MPDPLAPLASATGRADRAESECDRLRRDLEALRSQANGWRLEAADLRERLAAVERERDAAVEIAAERFYTPNPHLWALGHAEGMNEARRRVLHSVRKPAGLAPAPANLDDPDRMGG